jgi:hypothetical protein
LVAIDGTARLGSTAVKGITGFTGVTGLSSGFLAACQGSEAGGVSGGPDAIL